MIITFPRQGKLLLSCGGRELYINLIQRSLLNSAGGIILTSNHGRIRVNNTLEERLNLAQEEVRSQFCGS